MRGWIIAAFAGLSACAAPDLSYDAFERTAYRGYQASFSEQPFARGALSVVAREPHRQLPTSLSTFWFVRCGNAVCADTPHGPQGHVETTPDYFVVTGLYGHRSFWLSPGGDGAIRYPDGTAVPLAWNAVEPAETVAVLDPVLPVEPAVTVARLD